MGYNKSCERALNPFALPVGRKDEGMFGYVRPFKSELLVREYDQYKAAYCQLCRALKEHYGRAASFALSYDCTFYALLMLSTREARLSLHHGRCVMNPLKRCDFLESGGEVYHKAAALSVLLTYHKLRDNLEDDSFFKSLGSRLFLPFVSRKARKAAEEYPFLAQEAQKAMDGQRQAEENAGGVDACAEPTANLLAALFKELACDSLQGAALERFGYFLGRWVYLMDAADDLLDAEGGGLQPLYPPAGAFWKNRADSPGAQGRGPGLQPDAERHRRPNAAGLQPGGAAEFWSHPGKRGDEGPAGNPAGDPVSPHPGEAQGPSRAGGPALTALKKKPCHRTALWRSI